MQGLCPGVGAHELVRTIVGGRRGVGGYLNQRRPRQQRLRGGAGRAAAGGRKAVRLDWARLDWAGAEGRPVGPGRADSVGTLIRSTCIDGTTPDASMQSSWGPKSPRQHPAALHGHAACS